jgi:hypothetical protein
MNRHSQRYYGAYLKHIALEQAMKVTASFRFVARISPDRKPEYLILYQKTEWLVDVLETRGVLYNRSVRHEEKNVRCAHETSLM